MKKEGDKIDLGIELKDSNENLIPLKKILKDKTILYFYPKDSTPGCTTEACEFRDYNNDIKKLGCEIIGVSSDDQNSHKKFKEKNNLNFELFTDEDQSLQRSLGIWVEKNMYGKKYMGTQRSTFIVNKNGEISKIWDKVKPEGHAKEVYEFLKN